MSSEFQFVGTDTDALIASMIAAYEGIVGQTVQPASPERLFILWVVDVLVQTRVQINFAANQNIPSRATGKNLDALGELFYDSGRPPAKAASCTMRLRISAAQLSAVLVPAGTRVTDASSTLFWATPADAYIPIGATEIDVTVICLTAGALGNGFAPGQINTIVDLFPFFDSCENITQSDGGADEATDEEYLLLLRASEDAYSTAGPMGGYEYWAKTVSTEIADVVALMPKDPATGELMGGHVHIYAIMSDGTIASDTIKEKIFDACNDARVRPLTDFVSVEDPGVVDYNITLTFYIPADTPKPASEIQAEVEAAAAAFAKWQSGRLGRDINPSRLIAMIMETGVKRVDLSEPAFTVLSDGSDNTAPNVARVANITIINGGHENE